MRRSSFPFHRGALRTAWLSGLLAAACAAAPAQDLPEIGSTNVATADPRVPAPPTPPCEAVLFDGQTFADFDPKPFAYAPPAGCPGPWQKVVLSLDYSVTAGRQYDRTSSIWIGGALVFFGTTQEPSATVAPSWHVERDLTDYAPLFAGPHDGRAILGNFVGTSDGVDYTGVIHGTARLLFYPAAPTVFDHPPRPDALLPLAGDPAGGTASLSGDAQLAVTFGSLPRNIERAFLDVYAESQGGDEFWFFNLPDELAGAFGDGGGTAFRETEISVDGQPAGVAPVFPWVYTGGANPLLWRPIVGVQTLAFEPYRVDLTPFAGVLSDGRPHTVALGVFNAQDHFSTAANLLLYLDHGAEVVTGGITANTLAAQPAPVVAQDVATVDGTTAGTVSVSSQRDFTIAGRVSTSHGEVTTEIRQSIAFSNTQTLSTNADFYPYLQDVVQTTTVDSTTTRTSGGGASVVHEWRSYPFAFHYQDAPGADGNETFDTAVDQRFVRRVEAGRAGFALREAAVDSHLTTRAGQTWDADGNPLDAAADARHTYTYSDPFGACYARSVAASRRGLVQPGAVTEASDGDGCPYGNALSWFDAFDNYAASLAGATVRLLP